MKKSVVYLRSVEIGGLHIEGARAMIQNIKRAGGDVGGIASMSFMHDIVSPGVAQSIALGAIRVEALGEERYYTDILKAVSEKALLPWDAALAYADSVRDGHPVKSTFHFLTEPKPILSDGGEAILTTYRHTGGFAVNFRDIRKKFDATDILVVNWEAFT